MEALVLILVAVLLFTQSWYLLGLYAAPRTVGVIAGGLAVGLLATAAADGLSTPLAIGKGAAPMASAMQGMAILWSVYGVALAAHALWGFEEKALGLYALVLWVLSLVTAVLPWTFSEGDLGTNAVLVISVASVVLAVLAALLFFHLAFFRQRQMRAVAAWFSVVGSVGVGILGLALYFIPLS